MTNDPITDILTERGQNYGPFLEHAQITQTLKRMIETHARIRGVILALDQQEALDMICHKIGRIVNGNPGHIDSWDDIAGYARLVADRLRGVVR